MTTPTLVQLEQFSLIARLSKERADYAPQQILAQTDQEKAILAAHVRTLDGILFTLTGPVSTET